MYEKDGEKYYIVDSHLHFWDASPENCEAPRSTRRAGSSASTTTTGPRARRSTSGRIEKFQKYSEEDFDAGRLRGRLRRQGVLQPTYLKDWYTNGFNTIEQNADAGAKLPDKFILNGALGPARRRAPASSSSRAGPREYGLKGVQALHGRVEGRLARLEADRPRGATVPRASATSSASRTSTSTRARRSGRWTRTPSTSPTSTTSRRDFHGSSTSSSSTSACRASRTSAGSRRRSPTSTPAWPWSCRLMHARPQYFGKVMGELLFWVGEDQMLFALRLRHLGAEVADREVRRLGDARRHAELETTRGSTRDGKKQDPRPQRRQAVRRRGPGRSCSSRRRRRSAAAAVGGRGLA